MILNKYTSLEFVTILLDHGIQVSMDEKGRAIDNVFIERLWKSVKYEDIYLRDYCKSVELQSGIGQYFPFYNTQRLHSSLEYTPAIMRSNRRCVTFGCGIWGLALAPPRAYAYVRIYTQQFFTQNAKGRKKKKGGKVNGCCQEKERPSYNREATGDE